jgi:ATP-binding cassette subfamily B protein
MSKAELERDKTVTRAVHRLFWHGMLQNRLALASTYLCNMPAFFIFNVYVPLQIAYGIQAIITRHFDQVNHQAILILVVTLFGGVIYAFGTWTNHRTNIYGAGYIQRAAFANYLSKDYDFYAGSYVGALGADAVALRSAFQEYSLMVTFDLPKALVIIVVGLTVVLFKSVPLGLVSATCVLFVLIMMVLVAKYRLKYRRALSQAVSRLSGLLGDPLSHGTAVKSFAQERYEQQRLDVPLGRWQTAAFKTFDSSIPHSFLRLILLAITTAILLVVSAHLYRDGLISIAIVALVQLYIIRVINTTLEVGEIIKRYEALMSDAYEPVATMLTPTSVDDPAQPLQLADQKSHSIQFENVTYHYPEAAEGKYAIRDFSLTIKKGEKIGLIGYSGGGKTTITKLLLRFMDASEGTIQIDDLDVRNILQTKLRTVIAHVPQEPLLFHRSIRENIAYGRPEASQKDIEKAAKIAYVDEFVRELPEGYDSMVGERGVKLSGGQRQRVAIARALLKDAPILVLDEATSSLDSQSEQYIQRALWKLMEHRTAIVIAHRLSTIQRMDRIIVMDQGRIAQIGTHTELLKNNKGIYAQLWTHQSGGYLVET